MKVKMKISGGFRTMAGARTFACLRSVISTARKQDWNILQTLAATPATLEKARFRTNESKAIQGFFPWISLVWLGEIWRRERPRPQAPPLPPRDEEQPWKG